MPGSIGGTTSASLPTTPDPAASQQADAGGTQATVPGGQQYTTAPTGQSTTAAPVTYQEGAYPTADPSVAPVSVDPVSALVDGAISGVLNGTITAATVAAQTGALQANSQTVPGAPTSGAIDGAQLVQPGQASQTFLTQLQQLGIPLNVQQYQAVEQAWAQVPANEQPALADYLLQNLIGPSTADVTKQVQALPQGADGSQLRAQAKGLTALTILITPAIRTLEAAKVAASAGQPAAGSSESTAAGSSESTTSGLTPEEEQKLSQLPPEAEAWLQKFTQAVQTPGDQSVLLADLEQGWGTLPADVRAPIAKGVLFQLEQIATQASQAKQQPGADLKAIAATEKTLLTIAGIVSADVSQAGAASTPEAASPTTTPAPASGAAAPTMSPAATALMQQVQAFDPLSPQAATQLQTIHQSWQQLTDADRSSARQVIVQELLAPMTIELSEAAQTATTDSDKQTLIAVTRNVQALGQIVAQ